MRLVLCVFSECRRIPECGGGLQCCIMPAGEWLLSRWDRRGGGGCDAGWPPPVIGWRPPWTWAAACLGCGGGGPWCGAGGGAAECSGYCDDGGGCGGGGWAVYGGAYGDPPPAAANGENTWPIGAPFGPPCVELQNFLQIICPVAESRQRLLH